MITQVCTTGCVGASGVVFSGTVTNTGTVSLLNVTVTGTLCQPITVGTLKPGLSAPWNCTLACSPGGGLLVNKAVAQGTTPFPNVMTVSSLPATASCQCLVAGLSVTESGSSTCVGGTAVTFSGTVTNTGTVALSGVTVSGSVCSPGSLGSLAPGQSSAWNCTVSCVPGQVITNIVTASGHAAAPCSPSVSSSPASASGTGQGAAIMVTQTCATGCVGTTGVVFSGTVTNTGTVALTNVNVTGTACPGPIVVSPSTIAPGSCGTWSCTSTCAGTGSVSNTVVAHGAASSPCSGTVNSAAKTDTCACLRASIAVTESCEAGGGNAVFSGTVTNTGSVQLTNVTVTGSACSPGPIGNLAPGQSANWSCKVPCAPGASVTNKVTAHGQATAPCSSNVNSSLAGATCGC